MATDQAATCAAKNPSQIEAAFGVMVEQVDLLQKRVDMHIEKIRPILFESEVLGKGKENQPRPPEAPLAEIIRNVAERVGVISQKLADNTDCVAL